MPRERIVAEAIRVSTGSDQAALSQARSKLQARLVPSVRS